MGEIENIQVGIPLNCYENKLVRLVEALLVIDEKLFPDEIAQSKESGVA